MLNADPLRWMRIVFAIVLAMTVTAQYDDILRAVYVPMLLRPYMTGPLLYGILLTLSAWLASGRYTRLCALLLIMFYLKNTPYGTSAQLQFRFYLFWLIVIGNPEREEDLPMWAIRWMQINLALTFMSCAIYKLTGGKQWLSGEKMYYVLLDMEYSRFLWPELLKYAVIYKSMTWGSLLIQLCCPAIAILTRYKWIAVALLAMNQYFIGFFMYPVALFAVSTIPGIILFAKGKIKWA